MNNDGVKYPCVQYDYYNIMQNMLDWSVLQIKNLKPSLIGAARFNKAAIMYLGLDAFEIKKYLGLPALET